MMRQLLAALLFFSLALAAPAAATPVSAQFGQDPTGSLRSLYVRDPATGNWVSIGAFGTPGETFAMPAGNISGLYTFNIADPPFNAPCNGTGDDEPAIVAAIAAAGARGGGRVNVCPLVHTNETVPLGLSNVELTGIESGINSDACANAGTTWTWGGTAGGSVIDMTPPSVSGAPATTHGGVENVCLNGGGSAGIGIKVVNRFAFKLHNISVSEFTTAGLMFNTAATLATTFGTQRGDVSFIYCSQASQDHPCVVLDGTVNNGDTSLNDWHDFELTVRNGNGIEFRDADTNIIRHVRVSETGTGAPVRFFGSSTANIESNYNIVEGLSGGSNPVIFEELPAHPSTFNSVLWIDASNSNPAPQNESGGAVAAGHGYYSYDSGTISSINGCPLVYSTPFFALNCSIVEEQPLYIQPTSSNPTLNLNAPVNSAQNLINFEHVGVLDWELIDAPTTFGFSLQNASLGTAAFSVALANNAFTFGGPLTGTTVVNGPLLLANTNELQWKNSSGVYAAPNSGSDEFVYSDNKSYHDNYDTGVHIWRGPPVAGVPVTEMTLTPTGLGIVGSLTVTGLSTQGAACVSSVGVFSGTTGNCPGDTPVVAGSALTGTSLAAGIVSSSLTSVGILTILNVSGTIKPGGFTVAALPVGAEGQRAFVTDATSCTFLGSLTGGGSTYCPVTYTGSAWVGGG